MLIIRSHNAISLNNDDLLVERIIVDSVDVLEPGEWYVRVNNLSVSDHDSTHGVLLGKQQIFLWL